MKFVNSFKTWALNECSDFESKRKAAYIKSGMGGIDGCYYWHSYGNKTIILDMETEKTGTALCKEDDEFSSIIGVGVAWARLKGEEIPMEYKTVRLKTLKTGDKFIIANNKDFKETYTFVGRYNLESIDKCFCATGEKLEKLAAFYSDTVVIKL
jgi:hypothetical protein|nr:MAG TPA: hypothetical protein [Caudoviricetes sp.]